MKYTAKPYFYQVKETVARTSLTSLFCMYLSLIFSQVEIQFEM